MDSASDYFSFSKLYLSNFNRFSWWFVFFSYKNILSLLSVTGISSMGIPNAVKASYGTDDRRTPLSCSSKKNAFRDDESQVSKR